MDIATSVENLVQGVVEAEGFELVHIEFQPRGAASMLRIYIDKPGGVSLQDCQAVSKPVSVLLDVEDFVPHEYVLEVSSPGIERPLFKETDYERFKGREIRLMTTEKVKGRENFKGSIQDFLRGVLELECEGRVYRIPFQKIRKANLVYRFK